MSTLPADCNPAETEQGALTVYGSLMALMTYGAVSIRGEKSAASTKAPAKRMGSTKPHTANTTYIIHSAGKQLTVVPRGHHASPACSFTVKRPLPPLQERKDGLDCRVPQRGLAAAGERPTRLEVIWMAEKSEWQFLVDYVKR